MLALKHPKFAPLDPQHIGPAVTPTRDKANVVESIGKHEASKIALESLPRAE
jgi:hypothetical protein